MNQPKDLAPMAALVNYDRLTGLFTRLDGIPVGTAHSKGYVSIKAGGQEVLAHRLAWFFVYGKQPASIDHINRIKSDNRIDNLRPATASQNQCNRGVQSNSSSGVCGVARNTRDTAWQAYIKLNGKRKHLGLFREFADAVAARRLAESALFGAFAPNATA